MSQQTLTPEIIQSAARIFCRLNGKDPDAKFKKGDKLTNCDAACRPVADFALLSMALKEAMGEKERPSESEKPKVIPVNFN